MTVETHLGWRGRPSHLAVLLLPDSHLRKGPGGGRCLLLRRGHGREGAREVARPAQGLRQGLDLLEYLPKLPLEIRIVLTESVVLQGRQAAASSVGGLDRHSAKGLVRNFELAVVLLHDLLRLADAAHVDALRAHAHAHEPVLFEAALPHRLRNGARVQAVPCSTDGRGVRDPSQRSEREMSSESMYRETERTARARIGEGRAYRRFRSDPGS